MQQQLFPEVSEHFGGHKLDTVIMRGTPKSICVQPDFQSPPFFSHSPHSPMISQEISSQTRDYGVHVS